jgi:hypothetical protein
VPFTSREDSKMSKSKKQLRTEAKAAAKKRSLWHARQMMLDAVREQDIAWTVVDTMSQFGKKETK